MTSAAKRVHYHDIDGARSLLMFLSVALHAGTVYAPWRPWITSNTDRHEFFDWLIFGFHLFITPTFFFVGGFFTVLLLKRRSVIDFLKNRMLRTAVPLITIALTFNMIEHYLRYLDNVGNDSFWQWIGSEHFISVWAEGHWQLHLWFLVSLIPMFLLSAVIHGSLPADSKLRGWAISVADRLGDWMKLAWVFPLALAFFAFANFANLAVASRIPGAYDLLLPGFQSWYKLTSEFPFYVIGVMAALSPSLLNALTKWRVWMPYAAAAALYFQPYAETEYSMLFGAWMLFLNQLAIWTIVLFILQFFHRYFNNDNARTRWLADCALSMYLFHHMLVYAFGRMFVQYDWPIGLEWALVTAMAAITVIAFHELVVRRVYIVRLLFNGKTDVIKPKKAGDKGLASAA